AAVGAGLDVAGAGDRGAAQRVQVDQLVVDASDEPGRVDDQVHDDPSGVVAVWRKIRRRGRSTIRPSRADWTWASWPATRWRNAPLSRRSWAATPRTARCACVTSS